MPTWIIALKSRSVWMNLPAHLIHFCFAEGALVAQLHAHECVFSKKKKVLELTVSVNRQLFVLATSKPGCAINRKDKKVKQEELCWTQFWVELRKAQICLLFTSMLQQIRLGKGKRTPVLYICVSVFCCVLGTCGIVSVLELQPKGHNFGSGVPIMKWLENMCKCDLSWLWERAGSSCAAPCSLF